MSTNFENPNSGENQRRRRPPSSQSPGAGRQPGAQTEWPKLIVPERTEGRPPQKPARQPDRATTEKNKRTRNESSASAGKRKPDRQRQAVSEQKRAASSGRADRGQAAPSGKKSKKSVKASDRFKNIHNFRELLSELQRLAGFSSKQNIPEILKTTRHIFLFPVVFLYFEILLRIFGETGIFAHFIYPLLFSLGTGLFLGCITSAFRRKTNRIITIVSLLAVGLLFITECLIKDSFQVYMTFKSILSGAGGVMGGFASELINSIVFGIPVILLFFLPGILYIVFGKRVLPARRQKRPLVIMTLVCAAIFMGIGSMTASIGSSRAQYKTQYDFNTATQFFGLLTSFRLDGQYAIAGNEKGDELALEPISTDTDKENADSKDAEPKKKEYGEHVSDIDFGKLAESASDETLKNMAAYVNSSAPSKENDYTGLFKGKNLILICAEAFSDVVVNKELTPTLYRMVHNGFYFSDFYQPTWGGSTSTGEYSFLTGLAPLDGVKTMLETQNNNMYYTMGSQLQRLGYHSECYHNGTKDFYSRDLTHENLGYDKYTALGSGLEDIAGNYPPDSLFFDKTMDTYIDKQPFSIYYMTISGHCTYKANNQKVKDNLDAIKAAYTSRYKDTTNYYLCYQQELENALTLMIKKLEDAGIADDTVICMTSDHYPYGLEKTSTFGNTQDYVSDLYGYKPKNSWEKDHNTCIIWSGCLENENKDMACEISTPTYSLDILPTLSNLFDVDYDSRLLVGRDVFSDAEPLALWTNHSWVTTKGKYDSAKGEFYPNEGVKVDDDYVDKMKAIVANKLTYSSQVLKTDYFGELFGK